MGHDSGAVLIGKLALVAVVSVAGCTALVGCAASTSNGVVTESSQPPSSAAEQDRDIAFSCARQHTLHLAVDNATDNAVSFQQNSAGTRFEPSTAIPRLVGSTTIKPQSTGNLGHIDTYTWQSVSINDGQLDVNQNGRPLAKVSFSGEVACGGTNSGSVQVTNYQDITAACSWSNNSSNGHFIVTVSTKPGAPATSTSKCSA